MAAGPTWPERYKPRPGSPRRPADPEQIAKARHEGRIDAPVIEREEGQLTVVDTTRRGSQLTDAVDRGEGGLRSGIVAHERLQIAEQGQRFR
jgi:hypothetical protein